MTRNGIGIRTAQVRSERLVGQIHVYDGTGKGKSQAALWFCARLIGDKYAERNPRFAAAVLKGPRAYDEDGAMLQQGFPSN